MGKSYTVESRHQGTPQMITAIANNELEVSNLAYSSLAIAIENAGLIIRVIADEFGRRAGLLHSGILCSRMARQGQDPKAR
jgi:hypothetical protein